MITSPENRQFNLDKIGARERGKSHDDWVESSTYWNHAEEGMTRARSILNKIEEVAPPGWEETVKKMKSKKDISNPYALAWSMKNKGAKPHYKEPKK
jgi:hypothetical protein